MNDSSPESRPDQERSRDEVLGKLVCEYVDRLLDGDPVTKEEILAEHPELAPAILLELRTFADMDAAAEDRRPLVRAHLGDYTLRRELGRGGMGVVYEAWQSSVDRKVAIKVLPLGEATDLKSVVRFTREAKTAASLRHANIVSVYDMGMDGNTPYFVMEYVEGETLARVLAGLRNGGRTEELIRTEAAADEPSVPAAIARPWIETRDCLDIAETFAGAADGLQHAHSLGIVHRDIKPSNLILDREGRLRILDFGLARVEGQETLTASGDLLGTPSYMSPEQIRARAAPVDGRTDVYSLGATLYELLAHRPPFRGRNHQETLTHVAEREPTPLRRINPRIPRDLETIVLKCLSKAPRDRYGTAEALAQDLRRFVRGDPIEGKPASTFDRVCRGAWRNRVKLLGGVLAVLLVVVVLVAYTTIRETRRREIDELYRDRVTRAVLKLQLGELILSGERGGSGSLDPHHLFQAGDYDRFVHGQGLDPITAALRWLDEAVSLRPHRAAAYFHRARAHALQESKEDALADAERALALAPHLAPARDLASLLESSRRDGAAGRGARGPEDAPAWARSWKHAAELAAAGDRNRAAIAYDELVDTLSRNEEPYLGAALEWSLSHGNALLRAGRISEAIEAFVAMRAQWPDSVEPQLLLGLAYYRAGDQASGSRTFQRLHARHTGDEVTVWIAALLKSLGRYEDGLEWAVRVADETIRRRLEVDFLSLLGRYEDAIRAGREAITVDPRDAFTHHALAMALLERRELEEALSVAARAHELDPGNVDTTCLLAAVNEHHGNVERARELLEKAISLAPDEPRAYDQLGRLLWTANRLEEAESLYRKAISLVESQGGSPALGPHSNLGLRFLSVGRCEDAEALFAKALEFELRSSSALLHWGLSLRLRGADLVKAEEKVRRALEAAPGNATAHAVLAQVLDQMGRRDEAIAAAREALRRASGHGFASKLLAELHERNGDIAEAFAVCASLVEAQPSAVWAHRELLVLGALARNAGIDLSARWRQIGDTLDGFPLDALPPHATTTLAATFVFGRKDDGREAAEPLLRDVLERTNRESPDALLVLSELEESRGRPRKALLLVEEALRSPRCLRVARDTLSARRSLGLPSIPSFASADALVEGSTVPGNRGLPGDTPAISEYLRAQRLRAQGDPGGAANAFRAMLRRIDANEDALEDIETALVTRRLAECLLLEGRAGESEELMRAVLAGTHAEVDDWALWMVSVARRRSGNSVSIERFAKDATSIVESAAGPPRLGAELRWLLEQLAENDAARIDCGREGGASAGERSWGPDRFFDGGASIYRGPIAVRGHEDPTVLRRARVFPARETGQGYRIPLPPGKYRVTLHVAEIDFASFPRRFDMEAEGSVVLRSIEPRVGAASRHDFTVEVEDGLLDLRFLDGIGDPIVSGLEIERVATPPPR